MISMHRDSINTVTSLLEEHSKKNKNDVKVVMCLFKNGQMTRPEIVEKLSMKRTTVHNSLTLRLEPNEIITREINKDGSIGRPKVYFRLTNTFKVILANSIESRKFENPLRHN